MATFTEMVTGGSMRRLWATLASVCVMLFLLASVSTTSAVASQPTGSPILISVLDQETGPVEAPQVVGAAQAAADDINAAGGVKSGSGGAARPIKILACDSDAFTNTSAVENCARAAVSSGAVLSASDYSLGGDDVTVFHQAGIPMLGAFAFDASDLSTPGVYPFLNGTVLNGGGFEALTAAGAKSVEYFGLQNADAAQLAATDSSFLGKTIKVLPPVLIPPTPSADLTPYFATVASNNPGAVFSGIGNAEQVEVVKGLRAAGYKGLIGFTELNYPTKPWVSQDNGSIMSADYVSPADTSNPTISAFRHDMAKYAPKALADEWALNGWLSVKLAAQVASHLKTISPKNFESALQGRTVDLGVAPPFVLGKEAASLPTALNFPNVFRTTVQYHTIKGGQDEVSGNGNFANVVTHQNVPVAACSNCPMLSGG